MAKSMNSKLFAIKKLFYLSFNIELKHLFYPIVILKQKLNSNALKFKFFHISE